MLHQITFTLGSERLLMEVSGDSGSRLRVKKEMDTLSMFNDLHNTISEELAEEMNENARNSAAEESLHAECAPWAESRVYEVH